MGENKGRLVKKMKGLERKKKEKIQEGLKTNSERRKNKNKEGKKKEKYQREIKKKK